MTVKLNWRRADGPKQTYHATRGKLTYTVDFNGYRWVVRGWDDGEFVMTADGSTARSMKERAARHAEENS